MSEETKDGSVKAHPFEAAGLGKAPFTYVGCAEERGPKKMIDPKTGMWDGMTTVGSPGQPMGMCDYCGNGIAICCTIQSADGKRFVVGSTCVYKTDTTRLVYKVRSAVNQIRLEKRQARAAVKRKEGFARVEKLAARLPELKEAWAKEKHPRGFIDRMTGEPLTLMDWAEWMLNNAGLSGQLEVADKIEKALMGGK